MKKTMAIVLFSLLLNSSLALSQVVAPRQTPGMNSMDMNRDGKPDIIYYDEGKYIIKVEGDTNYDGKPDVIVHVKDGKFESAEVDTDYDGTPDKKFTDVGSFSKWLNENRPDWQDKLNRPDWEVTLFKF